MFLLLGRLLLTAVLLLIATKDWYLKRIPVWWLWLVTPVILIWPQLVTTASRRELVLGAVISGGLFLALHLVSRGKWFGSGDVWLAAFLGIVLGFPRVLLSLYLACMLSAVVVIWHVMTRHMQKRTDVRLAFAPILITSAIVTLWFGAEMMQWVQKWIG
jgi:prepilin signal peptidase PulO-like enzyme (type II secretory pathway)